MIKLNVSSECQEYSKEVGLGIIAKDERGKTLQAWSIRNGNRGGFHEYPPRLRRAEFGINGFGMGVGIRNLIRHGFE